MATDPDSIQWQYKLVLHHGLRWWARLLTSGCSSSPDVSISSSLPSTQLSHFSSPICPPHILDIVVAPAAGGPYDNWWAPGCPPPICTLWFGGRQTSGCSLCGMVAGGTSGALCLPVLHGVAAGRLWVSTIFSIFNKNSLQAFIY